MTHYLHLFTKNVHKYIYLFIRKFFKIPLSSCAPLSGVPGNISIDSKLVVRIPSTLFLFDIRHITY